jgi:hypothetical protein
MTNPLDELKELEVRRAEFIKEANSSDTDFQLYRFDSIKGDTYRRLALEVAAEVERKDLALQQSDVIINNLNNTIQGHNREIEAVTTHSEKLKSDLDFMISQSEVIFSPSDPRVRVGEEYEFSNTWDFGECKTWIAVLTDSRHGPSHPFIGLSEHGTPFQAVFLRELPKEERGQNE